VGPRARREGRFADAEEVARRAAAVPGFDASPLWLALAA